LTDILEELASVIRIEECLLPDRGIAAQKMKILILTTVRASYLTGNNSAKVI
jgi:hypothetical protein